MQIKERKKQDNSNHLYLENDETKINVNKKTFCWKNLYQELQQQKIKLLSGIFITIILVSIYA